MCILCVCVRLCGSIQCAFIDTHSHILYMLGARSGPRECACVCTGRGGTWERECPSRPDVAKRNAHVVHALGNYRFRTLVRLVAQEIVTPRHLAGERISPGVGGLWLRSGSRRCRRRAWGWWRRSRGWWRRTRGGGGREVHATDEALGRTCAGLWSTDTIQQGGAVKGSGSVLPRLK